jgi:hypothetical protein
MATIDLNIKELKDYLKHFVTNNQYLQSKGMTPVAVNVEGEAGIGKTSAIEQLAEELSLDIVKLNLAQIEELGDLVGFPTKQYQMALNKGTEQAPKWLVNWVDESLVDDYRDKGYVSTNKSRMGYCAPEWIAGKKEGGILLLDDYSRADSRFQQACMDLIQKQEYISWKLPKNWHIFLSTNPDNGDYHVQSMDKAQKTRMINTSVKFDVECWAEWAENVSMDGRCINFMLMNPEVITGDVNSRCASTFFNSISSFDSFEKNLPMIQMIGEGSVGGEVATLFTTFINNKLDKLVDPKVMVLEKDEEKSLGAIKDAIYVDGNYRADIASVLATRITNFAIKYAKSNPITPEITKRMIDLTTKEDLFTDDLRYNISSQVVTDNKAKWSKYMLDPKVIMMVTR